MNTDAELYDRNDYYQGDAQASRLAPSLNGLLHFLDWFKAWNFVRISHSIRKLMAGYSAKTRPLVIDIGAGDGKFLYFMRKFGYEPQGTTASSISQEAAKKQFGIDLIFGKEIPETLRAKKYQAITYWHVFEHLENPRSHVEVWPHILASDGLIMIEVPNIESIGAKLSFNAWLGSDVIHHINHMTEKQIAGLLEQYGFQIVRREGFSLKFTYPFLWSALLGRLFGERLYSFDSVFGTLKNPLAYFRKNPLAALNALLSIIYLAPFIAILTLIGLVMGRGEVTRLYIRQAK